MTTKTLKLKNLKQKACFDIGQSLNLTDLFENLNINGGYERCGGQWKLWAAKISNYVNANNLNRVFLNTCYKDSLSDFATVKSGEIIEIKKRTYHSNKYSVQWYVVICVTKVTNKGIEFITFDSVYKAVKSMQQKVAA